MHVFLALLLLWDCWTQLVGLWLNWLKNKRSLCTVGTDHTPCTHASHFDMVAKPGHYGDWARFRHCSCSGTGLPLAEELSRNQGTDVHWTKTKEELKLEHYWCFGCMSYSENEYSTECFKKQSKYSASILPSVCESHTQKELLGLNVSADAASQLHNFAQELPLPRDFDGTRMEHWKNFSFQLKAYLEMLEPDFVNCMNFAAAS